MDGNASLVAVALAVDAAGVSWYAPVLFRAVFSVRSAVAGVVFEGFAEVAVLDANALFARAFGAVVGGAALVVGNARVIAGFVSFFADAVALVAFLVFIAGNVRAEVDRLVRSFFRKLILACWPGLECWLTGC